MNKEKIASVLEEAARGYRDDKYGWCAGAWVVDDDVSTEEFQDDSQQLSACAEGALLFAAGFSWHEINSFGDSDDKRYAQLNPKAIARFRVARDSLLSFVQEHSEEYVCNSIETFSVPGWNDQLETALFYQAHKPTDSAATLQDSHWRAAREQAKEQAKSLVIDAMEATAKDLRNG